MHEIERRIENKSAVVGIIGLGYVGLPLAIRFSESGFKVLGLDIDLDKVEKLNSGRSYIEHVKDLTIESTLKRGFYASTDFSKVADCDALIICVPTPLDRYREPDLSFVTGTVDSMLSYIKKGQLISLESTTYPGTTEEVLLPRIEASGLRVGEDIALVYSPEREDPGNLEFTTQTIPKVCAGLTDRCTEIAVTLYSKAFDVVVPVSSTKVAEMSKLLENIYRSVNIGLANEMKIVADKMGIDIHEVISAAATKPFGFTAFYPGPGLGGHCIPVDPFYLTWKAREYGLHTRFIELAGELNSSMPEWVLGKLVAALNERSRAINGSRILILGLAYKKNVDDLRESPSVKLMKLLKDRYADLSYSDPHIPVFKKMRDYSFDLTSVQIKQDTLSSYDAVILATDHDKFDYETILKYSSLIIDTRGKYPVGSANVVRA